MGAEVMPLRIFVQCAWCYLWEWDEVLDLLGGWHDAPPSQYTEGNLISHGICPTCKTKVEEDLHEAR